MPAQSDASTFAVHVDCDNLSIYETEFGIPVSDRQDLIYTQALPALMEIFARWNIRATFFVIGNELRHSSCVQFCRNAVAKGHRIGNHSFFHRVDYAQLTGRQKRQEIIDTDRAIAEATGQKPLGFRAPGYHIDAEVISTLAESGYRYDSSILPGPAGRMIGAYMALIGRGGIGKSFGPWSSVFASQRPHLIDGTHGGLWEYPIATFPVVRLPIHSTFAYRFGEGYLRTALRLLKGIAGHHIYLLHAIDGLDHPSPEDFKGNVIPLRLTFAQRCGFLERLGALLQGRVALTEEIAAAASA